MYKIITKYVSTASEKSGCNLCQTNIYVEETYYELVNYEGEVLLRFCEICTPYFKEQINDL